MSLKVLCFGDNDLAEQVVSRLRAGEREVDPEEQIVVDNVDVNGKNFLIFCIKNSELITSQATGTTAILYFLDVNTPIFEQKHLLFGILDERRQFQGLPIIIAFDKDQYLQIKDIVNSFELFKVKDRASMIKQINLSDRETINQIFSWIQNQNQFNKTRTFDAPPKIVKMKPKYRESEVEATEKKYEEIIRDKNFKGLNIGQQEQAYINKEKQRIKNQNMEKQLANFNKNKKKMSPYDIKATPNPKIQANLHFFLKDPKVQKAQQVNIKIQTDEFKQLPKPKPYVAKKTGINTGTQIQPTQLFDFDKEVRPILEILTTRALETATLQIQEHQQCLKIAKYKNSYNERMKKQKKHQNDNIQAELQTIKEKQRILDLARKKDQNKRNVAKKQSYYALANRFLDNIYKSAAVSLYQKNYFPDEFEHHLKTQYIPDVLELALKSYEKIKEKESSLSNVFGEDCIKPILQATKQPKAAKKIQKKQRQMRMMNKSDKVRYVNIVYNHPTQHKFSSFAKYINKELDGTAEQYLKTREEQIQQADDKFQSGEIDEAEMAKIKDRDDLSFAQDHKEYLLNCENKLCFSVTQNRFEKPQKTNAVVAGLFCFDNEGSMIETIQSTGPSENPEIKVKKDLRVRTNKINMDDGIIFSLDEIPEKIRSMILYTKINDVGSYVGENEAKTIRNAVYGIEFYQKAIPIQRENFGEKIKWEQLPKSAPNEGEQGNQVEKKKQTLLILSYHLRRKTRQLWHLQHINTVTKPTDSNQLPELIQKISAFYKQNLQIFKVEQQVKSPSKNASRGSKRKSKKVIEEKTTPRKIELGIQSKILRQVEVNLKQNWSQIFNKLGDEVIDWKQFIQNAPDGWYLQFRNQKLQNVEQLKKYTKIGDLVLKKVEPVIEAKSEQNINEEDQNKEDQDA